MKVKYQIILFLLLLICGISLPSLSGLNVFPFSVVPSGFTVVYSAALSIAFLVVALVLRTSNHKEYWPIFFVFFIASIAIFFDLLVNVPSGSMDRLVFDMLVSASIIVSIIILLTLISGGSLRSIFLQKGNLKSGLIIGFSGFFFFALTALPAAELLFQAQNLNIGKVISWLPWILPLVLLNGLREELLYRGLFLRKFEAKLGPKTSNLLQAIIFSLSHSVAGVGLATYTPYVWVLVVFTFVLGLAWGFIMQRTDSILGSVLFHAGSDIPVFLGIFSSLF